VAYSHLDDPWIVFNQHELRNAYVTPSQKHHMLVAGAAKQEPLAVPWLESSC